MNSFGKIKGAVIQQLDAIGRWITVDIPSGQGGAARTLTVRVDPGALVATKHHQLMKLDEFQIGHRVSVIYSPQPDGVLLSKTLILERGTPMAAGRSAPR